MSWLGARIAERLAALETNGLLRTLRPFRAVAGPVVEIEGKRVVQFGSSDYLGLSRRIEAPGSWAGTGGSRLLCGTTSAHLELEQEFAEFKGFESALFFGSAYLANLGLLSAVADRETTVLSDERNHASLIDGIRLSRAQVRIYPHRSVAAVRDLLRQTPGRCLVVTEHLFSMDGDRAPLAELAKECAEHGAELIVDDTHAVGILGPDGRGAGEGFAQVANLAKAGGFFGGFVVGSRSLIRLMISTSRPFLYTTALPEGVCRAALASLGLLQAAGAERKKLWDNCARFASALGRLGFGRAPEGPIFPVVLGDAGRALAASRHLFEEGFFVPAIRPPTVPPGGARLRISLTALHSPEHLDALVDALQRL